MRLRGELTTSERWRGVGAFELWPARVKWGNEPCARCIRKVPGCCLILSNNPERQIFLDKRKQEHGKVKLHARLIQLVVQGLGCPLYISSHPISRGPCLFTLCWVILSSSFSLHDGYKILSSTCFAFPLRRDKEELGWRKLVTRGMRTPTEDISSKLWNRSYLPILFSVPLPSSWPGDLIWINKVKRWQSCNEATKGCDLCLAFWAGILWRSRFLCWRDLQWKERGEASG